MSYFDENEIADELYIHLVWSTRGQKASIVPAIAHSLYHYIGDLVLKSNCTLIAGRVFTDHLQLIVKFHPDIALQNLIADIKVGSTLWVTTHFSEMVDFAWQKSDFVFTISYEEVGNLINRIESSSSFVNEISTILSLNGLVVNPSEIFA